MNPIASVAVCMIPLVAVCASLALLDTGIRFVHIVLAAVLGLLAVVPIAAMQMLVDRADFLQAGSLGAVLLATIVVNGLVEEAIKTLLLLVLPAKKYDVWRFLWCAMISGLALGCFESVIYLVSGYERVALRLVTAVLLHAFCAGLDGIFAWRVRRARFNALPLVLSVLIHGAYNYFAGFSTGIRWVSLVAVLLALAECRSQGLSAADPNG